MDKKKRKPGNEKSKRRLQLPADLPDRRAMEGMMQQLVGGLQGQENQDTPLGKAQALMYRAFEEPDEQRRVRMAKDALEICPNCADAHVLLAEHARRRKEALHLYEQGVTAGERALGPDAFQQNVGHFWGVLETRPYMRARLGLANSLWTAGRREEAVQHLQDMLRLNPGDNQGVRYTLAGFLLFLDRDDGELAGATFHTCSTIHEARGARTAAFDHGDELEFYDELTRYVEDQSIGAAGDQSARDRAVGFTMALFQRQMASSVYAVRRSLERMRDRRQKILECRDEHSDGNPAA